jgi:hypothetical protein
MTDAECPQRREQAVHIHLSIESLHGIIKGATFGHINFAFDIVLTL